MFIPGVICLGAIASDSGNVAINQMRVTRVHTVKVEGLGLERLRAPIEETNIGARQKFLKSVALPRLLKIQSQTALAPVPHGRRGDLINTVRFWRIND